MTRAVYRVPIPCSASDDTENNQLRRQTRDLRPHLAERNGDFASARVRHKEHNPDKRVRCGTLDHDRHDVGVQARIFDTQRCDDPLGEIEQPPTDEHRENDVEPNGHSVIGYAKVDRFSREEVPSGDTGGDELANGEGCCIASVRGVRAEDVCVQNAPR